MKHLVCQCKRRKPANSGVAENTPEYVNGLKVVWEETSNDVIKVTRDGAVKGIGEGTVTLKGYVVPTDSIYLLRDNGYSETVDNYNIMPEAMVIPVEVTLKVAKADALENATTEEVTTENVTTEEVTTENVTTEEATTDKTAVDKPSNPDTGDNSFVNMWLIVIMASVAVVMGCYTTKKKGEKV